MPPRGCKFAIELRAASYCDNTVCVSGRVLNSVEEDPWLNWVKCCNMFCSASVPCASVPAPAVAVDPLNAANCFCSESRPLVRSSAIASREQEQCQRATARNNHIVEIDIGIACGRELQ